jgi:hypothetical protein
MQYYGPLDARIDEILGPNALKPPSLKPVQPAPAPTTGAAPTLQRPTTLAEDLAAMQPAPKAQGFIEGTTSAIGHGWDNATRAMQATANSYSGDLARVEQLAQEHQAAQANRPEALKGFYEAFDQNRATYTPNVFTRAVGSVLGDGTERFLETAGDVGGAIWDNPEGAWQASAEQLANMAAPMTSLTLRPSI